MNRICAKNITSAPGHHSTTGGPRPIKCGVIRQIPHNQGYTEGCIIDRCPAIERCRVSFRRLSAFSGDVCRHSRCHNYQCSGSPYRRFLRRVTEGRDLGDHVLCGGRGIDGFRCPDGSRSASDIIRMLTVAIFGFAIISLLCGVTTDIRALVFLRVLQGLCGGPLIPLSQALIMKICPPKHLEMSMGLWMMTSILAPIAGPVIGGILADTVGWRWAFYINVPVGAICAFLIPRFFRALRDDFS